MAVKHPLIRSTAYAFDGANDNRVSVWHSRAHGGWRVDRVTPYVSKTFPTHAEAIAYAQKIARQA